VSTAPTARLRIGALARLSGATPRALRLYEEIGLLPAPAREGKYRVYGAVHLDVVRLIREAQGLGFKLQELQALAAEMPLAQALQPEAALQALRDKRRQLDQQIEALQARAGALDRCIAALGDPRLHAALCTLAPQRPAAPALAETSSALPGA